MVTPVQSRTPSPEPANQGNAPPAVAAEFAAAARRLRAQRRQNQAEAPAQGARAHRGQDAAAPPPNNPLNLPNRARPLLHAFPAMPGHEAQLEQGHGHHSQSASRLDQGAVWSNIVAANTLLDPDYQAPAHPGDENDHQLHYPNLLVENLNSLTTGLGLPSAQRFEQAVQGLRMGEGYPVAGEGGLDHPLPNPSQILNTIRHASMQSSDVPILVMTKLNYLGAKLSSIEKVAATEVVARNTVTSLQEYQNRRLDVTSGLSTDQINWALLRQEVMTSDSNPARPLSSFFDRGSLPLDPQSVLLAGTPLVPPLAERRAAFWDFEAALAAFVQNFDQLDDRYQVSRSFLPDAISDPERRQAIEELLAEEPEAPSGGFDVLAQSMAQHPAAQPNESGADTDSEDDGKMTALG